jgi:hypothetical protein
MPRFEAAEQNMRANIPSATGQQDFHCFTFFRVVSCRRILSIPAEPHCLNGAQKI